MEGNRLPYRQVDSGKCSRKRNLWKDIVSCVLMKNTPVEAGIIAIASPLPLFFCMVFWSWVWFFGIGIGMLNYETVPQWILVISLLPLAVSPAIGILGVVHGFVKLRQKYAWLGIILSIIGLIENFLLIYGMGYIGSRF